MPARVAWSTYEDAMRVPVVSLISATISTGVFWKREQQQGKFPLVTRRVTAETWKGNTHKLFQALLEHGRAVLALRAGRPKALGPPDEDAVVDAFLPEQSAGMSTRRVTQQRLSGLFKGQRTRRGS